MQVLIDLLLDQCLKWKTEIFPSIEAKDIFIASYLGSKEGPRRFTDNVWNQTTNDFLQTGNFTRTKTPGADNLPIIWLCIGKVKNGYTQLPASKTFVQGTNHIVDLKRERAQVERPVKKELRAKRCKNIKKEPKELRQVYKP